MVRANLGQHGRHSDSPELTVLYEDNHLIAVHKPAGLLTQADQTGEPNLMDEVKRWLAVQHNKPGRVFLGLMHRLDRPVSGVILFAKTSKAASRISEQFRSRSVDKVYWAAVEGTPRPPSGRLEHFIEHIEGQRAVHVHARASSTAKLAVLTYTMRAEHHNYKRSLLEIHLETGRKHQIRAQLASFGHPILGDRLYGAKTQLVDADSIGLCAVRLTVAHPITRTPLVLQLPDVLLPDALRF